MMDYEDIISALNSEIKGELPAKRSLHTENVAKLAVEMAREYGADEKSAEIAALAHDRFRDTEMDNNTLAHGPIAAEYLRDKYGITDEDILNSVRYHTTGRKGMSLLEKIIFLADAIEKDRDYPGVHEIREAAGKGLDCGVEKSLSNTIEHLKEKGTAIDNNTIDAYDFIRKGV